MKWISESDQLPPIAQKVFLAVPRQHGEFWDLYVAQILVRHEDVHPQPIKKGARWATEFWWSPTSRSNDSILVTGNAWWALLDDIPLPPGAEHKQDRGFHYIAQPKPVFVPQER